VSYYIILNRNNRILSKTSSVQKSLYDILIDF